jgi:hypothetical protein
MSHKIDKSRDAAQTLKQIMQKYPQNLVSGDYGYTGLFMNIYRDAQTVVETLGPDGLDVPEYRGVKAIFIGSTETSEYVGVYVYYGTCPARDDEWDTRSKWYPVIEYKRVGLAPLRELKEHELLHALTVTPEFREGIWKKVPKSVRNKVLGYGTGQPKRMISLFGSVYVSNAVDSVPDSQALWARIYEY